MEFNGEYTQSINIISSPDLCCLSCMLVLDWLMDVWRHHYITPHETLLMTSSFIGKVSLKYRKLALILLIMYIQTYNVYHRLPENLEIRLNILFIKIEQIEGQFLKRVFFKLLTFANSMTHDDVNWFLKLSISLTLLSKENQYELI